MPRGAGRCARHGSRVWLPTSVWGRRAIGMAPSGGAGNEVGNLGPCGSWLRPAGAVLQARHPDGNMPKNVLIQLYGAQGVQVPMPRSPRPSEAVFSQITRRAPKRRIAAPAWLACLAVAVLLATSSHAAANHGAPATHDCLGDALLPLLPPGLPTPEEIEEATQALECAGTLAGHDRDWVIAGAAGLAGLAISLAGAAVNGADDAAMPLLLLAYNQLLEAYLELVALHHLVVAAAMPYVVLVTATAEFLFTTVYGIVRPHIGPGGSPADVLVGDRVDHARDTLDQQGYGVGPVQTALGELNLQLSNIKDTLEWGGVFLEEAVYCLVRWQASGYSDYNWGARPPGVPVSYGAKSVGIHYPVPSNGWNGWEPTAGPPLGSRQFIYNYDLYNCV